MKKKKQGGKRKNAKLTDERMSSGGLNAPTFHKSQRLKRELNLNINTKPAITYTHCCVYVAF